MMDDDGGLHVHLTTPAEIAKMIRDRTHWIIAFGKGAMPLIDEVDKALGVAPTFPTIVIRSVHGILTVTVVPKTRIPRKVMMRAIERVTTIAINEATPDQDLFLLSNDDDELHYIAQFLQEMVGEEQPC